MSPFDLSYPALWLLVVFQAMLLLGVVRALYRIRQQEVGLRAAGEESRAGEVAPPFTGRDLSGNWIRSDDFAGDRQVLLFVSPHCRSCENAVEDIAFLDGKIHGRATVICTGGTEEECVRFSDAHALDRPMIVDDDMGISRLFRVDVVPSAFVLDEEGRIESYGNPMRDGKLVQEQLSA